MTVHVRTKLHLMAVITYEQGGKTFRFESRSDTIPEDQGFGFFSGHAELMIDDPVASEQFELGKDYYVDFTLVPPTT
jgi:hypothetical protein